MQTEIDEPDSETYNAVMSAYRAMRKSIAEEVSKVGLTPPQFRLLRTLARQGAMSLNKMSQEMLVTPPNITGIVDRLEAKHLVRRVASRDDRRAIKLELSPEGKRLQQKLAKKHNEFLKEVLSKFTRSEQTTLRKLLTKLGQEILRERKRLRGN